MIGVRPLSIPVEPGAGPGTRRGFSGPFRPEKKNRRGYLVYYPIKIPCELSYGDDYDRSIV